MFRVVRWHLPAAWADADIAVQPGSSIPLSGKLMGGMTMLLNCARVAAANPDGLRELNDDVKLGVMRYELDWTDDEADRYKIVFERQCKPMFVVRCVDETYDEVQGLGLVLMPCAERPDEGERYRRVGYFRVHMDCEWEDGLLEREIVIV